MKMNNLYLSLCTLITSLNIFGGVVPYTPPHKGTNSYSQQGLYEDEDFKAIVAIAEQNKTELYLSSPQETMRSLLINPRFFCACYKDPRTDVILGFIVYQKHGDFGEINLLATSQQRKGIGSALLKYAKKQLLKKGCTTVGICTGKTNDKARNCYLKNNFVVHEERSRESDDFTYLYCDFGWYPYLPGIGWQPYVLRNAKKAGIALGAGICGGLLGSHYLAPASA